MAKRVMLAVAGAGKTYHLCNSINIENKNLILAFTNENVSNIYNELISAHGMIPDKTKVMTFHSFVYRYLICPFEPSICDFFKVENKPNLGVCVYSSPASTLLKGKKSTFNPQYHKKDDFRHYRNIYYEYYCDTMSELLMFIHSNQKSLFEKILQTLPMFYDNILVDEFQDFRKHDYDLLLAMSNFASNILLVGDYYQHSVSGDNNSGKPFESKKTYISYDCFVNNLIANKFIVDNETLKASRRCSNDICKFVTYKFGIDISSNNTSKGSVFVVNEDNAISILENDQIIKLVYSKSKSYKFNSMNWSYSKGDTFNDVCVILTSTADCILEDDFENSSFSSIILNKLYVAMTRPKNNLYIMSSSVFGKYKNNYLN
ncbi:MAG: AAA family ATPase [Oscillospiraceae bacterium]|nr:AAA family ATPase [Oscillospiraceae bacterium]